MNFGLWVAILTLPVSLMILTAGPLYEFYREMKAERGVGILDLGWMNLMALLMVLIQPLGLVALIVMIRQGRGVPFAMNGNE